MSQKDDVQKRLKSFGMKVAICTANFWVNNYCGGNKEGR